MAKLDLRLGTSPAVKSPAQIAFEIIVWNTGPAPFWIPHTLAMPSGALEVLWSFNNETTQTRPVSPSCGDWTLEYVHVPAASCYGRRVDLAPMDGRSIRIDGPTGNDPWPPGHYEFRVRMSLADGDAEAGVPGGVFESEPVHVEVTK